MLNRKEHYSPSMLGVVVALFLSLVMGFAFSGHAEAHTWRHRHHHHAHHHHVHHHHVHHHRAWHHRHHHRCRDVRWHRHYPDRHTAHAWSAELAGGQSDILATAERFLGDRNPTGFRGPYCKAFVNMIARETGHAFNRSLRAIDALHMGYRVRSPAPGDVAVMAHHVTFYVGRGGRGFMALGGNQGRERVTLSSYPIDRVIAWVRLR